MFNISINNVSVTHSKTLAINTRLCLKANLKARFHEIKIIQFRKKVLYRVL